MIKAGIIGATGYTGIELLRILSTHPEVELQCATSDTENGKKISDILPSLYGQTELRLSPHDNEILKSCDLVFFATPTGTAMHRSPQLLEAGVRIIDLSADFRLQNAAIWSKWYGKVHSCPELLSNAVYGLPETNRDSIKNASLVANPGCYPTAIILGLLPALETGIITTDGLVADAKSGISGAGRKATLATQFSEIGESFTAYAASGHRHHPEITQTLETISEQRISLTFVPHLVPMVRGIHATLYTTLRNDTEDDIQKLYKIRYENEFFVNVLPSGSHPSTASVRGSNHCRIAIHQSPGNKQRLIILSVIDNLVKGAAGQAVQNMNLMFGLVETTGLEAAPLIP